MRKNRLTVYLGSEEKYLGRALTGLGKLWRKYMSFFLERKSSLR